MQLLFWCVKSCLQGALSQATLHMESQVLQYSAGMQFPLDNSILLARQGTPAVSGLQVAGHQCKWCLNHEVPGKDTAPTASWQSFYGASESCLRLLDLTGREIGTNASSATVPAICGNSSAGCGLS